MIQSPKLDFSLIIFSVFYFKLIKLKYIINYNLFIENYSKKLFSIISYQYSKEQKNEFFFIDEFLSKWNEGFMMRRRNKKKKKIYNDDGEDE